MGASVSSAASGPPTVIFYGKGGDLTGPDPELPPNVVHDAEPAEAVSAPTAT